MASTTERYKNEGTLNGRAAYRTSLTTADSLTTLDTPLQSGALLRPLSGRPTLAVTGEFATSADSVTVMVLIYDYRNSAGGVGISGSGVLLCAQKAVLTADANARKTASGRYVGAPGLFDTFGGSHYEVRLYTAGAAAVDLRTWEY